MSEDLKSLPIVFLPGTLCDERMWTYQRERFPHSQVIDLRTQSTIESMLSSVREAPYERFVLVGFSLGGYVAQEFSLSDPDRVHHLVLMGSSSQTYPAHEREIILKSRPLIEKGFFKGITDKRLREFLHPDSYAKPELRDLIHSMAGSDAAEVYLRQLDATMERPELTEKLLHLKCPLTAMAGREDKIVPVESILEFKSTVPGAQVHVIEGCGHFVPLEKPGIVNGILEKIVGQTLVE
jgi:pimeloyl-ACP methyl ester carboxylesterase